MSLMGALILVAIIVALIALGQPIYVLIGVICAYLLLATGIVADFQHLTGLVEQTRNLAENEVLLAIPFFIVAGAIMTEGDIARRLIAFAKALFGWLPGGLAISAIFACVFFAAISGSSPVTVIAIGSIMYPALVKDGYGRRFSNGLVTSAGSLGILIPPSIPMIVYAIVLANQEAGFREPERTQIVFDGADLGVIDLFLAGIGPGILIAVLLSSYAFTVGARRRVHRQAFSFAEVYRALRHGFWALMLPILILGGIYAGAFNITPAACVAVVYSLVVELFIHRSISYGKIHKLIAESMLLIGSLLLILALAQSFNYLLYRAGVAQSLVAKMYEWNLGPVAFLLAVNVLLLLAGCFMDILSAILILVPLLAPVGHQLGIHPLHLGVIFIVNLEIGYLTPPLGINLFVSSTLFRKSLGEVIRAVIPFTAIMLGALLVVTYVPSVSLGLVSVWHDGSMSVPFPKPHIAMDEIEAPESIRFMSQLAEQAEEAEAAQEAAPQVLSLEELTRQATQQLEQEAVQSLAYDSLPDLLFDYRRVFDNLVEIRDLAVVRDWNVEESPDGEDDPGGPDEQP